jgi:DNA repair exonuclease SbcCD ATPase subunit
LTEWIDANDKEVQKSLELATLEADNKKFKTVLNTAINLQNDVASLQGQLHSIDSTLQDFEQATGNTDGGKSANIYKQLQERLDTLTSNYSDFLKRSKQTSDQCERYLITYDEVNHLNEQVLKSMNEFDQNLASNGNKPQVNIYHNILAYILFSPRKPSRTIVPCKFSFSMFNNNWTN